MDKLNDGIVKEQLLKSERRFQAMIERASDAITLIDTHGKIYTLHLPPNR